MTSGTVEVVWLETQGSILKRPSIKFKGRNPDILTYFNAFSRVLFFHTEMGMAVDLLETESPWG